MRIDLNDNWVLGVTFKQFFGEYELVVQSLEGVLLGNGSESVLK